MAGRIQHVVITRINVSRGFGAGDGRALDPVWLERELGLFEDICLPSVRAQEVEDFTWLLLTSDETPERYRRRIAGYAATDHRVVVREMRDYSLPGIGRLVDDLVSPATSLLVSSRVDADDALARSYLTEVRRVVADQEFEFVNCEHGYQFELPSLRLFECSLRSNMFLSLIERVGPAGSRSR